MTFKQVLHIKDIFFQLDPVDFGLFRLNPFISNQTEALIPIETCIYCLLIPII